VAVLQVDPASFSCPTHGHDLTPQVVEALEERPPPMAYRPGRRREFEVLVSCPGDAPPDGPHQLACVGRYWR
jgi:hypothetical protein